MNKLNRIGMFAAIALAFVGCSKEIDIQKPEDNSGTHTLTFKVEKAVDTRTAIVEGDDISSYIWTAGDDEYFHIYENGKEATEISMALSENNSIATFTATFNNSDATSFEYTAIYASSMSNSGNPLVIASQKPTLTSFDPSADILVSTEPITLSGNVKADANTTFLFKLRRVVSVNKMTLKGLVPGETIQTVELSSDQNFSANYIINSGNYNSAGKKLTIDYTSVTATVGTDGSFPVYFVSAPVTEASFSVRVTTNQHVYFRDDFTSKLTLKVGTFRRFGINLSGYGEAISTGTKYYLVNSVGDLYSGATYLIVGGEKSYALGEQKTNNRGAIAVTDKDGVITIDNTVDVYPVVIETTNNGGYTFFDTRNNGYLYTNSSSGNHLKNQNNSDEYSVWTITINNGVASINNVKNTSRGQMRFNPNNNSPLFASYAENSTTGDPSLALYVDLTTCVANPRIIATPSVIDNISYKGVTDATNITFELKDITGNATVTCDGTTVTSAEVVGNAIKYSVSSNTGEERTGWIRIAVGEVFAEVTVNQVAAPTLAFNTIAELNELASELDNNETATYLGKLTNAVVSFVPDTKNAIVKDATGSILVYNNDGHSLLQGQTFTGDIEVTVKMYFTTIEITAFDATFTGEQTVVAPESLTLGSLFGHFATYQNTYVQVDDLTVNSRDGKNISVSNGEYTYVVYDNEDSSTASTGDIISVVGTVADHSGTNQIKAWNSNAITITEVAPKAVTFNQPSAGGSFTVSVGGSNITSGATVASGTTVTLTATPETDYTFNGWTVSGATVADASAETTTFTMGTSAVSISASFTSNSGGGTLTLDFENAASSYSDWTITTITTQKGTITAHGGSYYGNTDGKTAGSIVTKNKLTSPGTLTFYISKESNNTTASSWLIKVSSDGSNWTQVGDAQSASSGITKGTWTEVTRDLSSYKNVYVKIEYSGTTAIRCIDDISLSYN